MKIREIDIENFGIFSDRHFDFGDSSFQLIHGPNEAGKSTLLHLLRQLLFGFPGGSSPYQFDTHSSEMAARALIDVSDGRRISFRRRKGRKGTVVGEVEGTTETINENSLSTILGGANAKLYEHVFGFSLTELSQGEESLKHANLNEAMFGGSLGGPSNLQEIQKGLDDEVAGLFKSGNAVKPVINSLLKDIRSHSAAIKDATLKPREFEDKEKALKEAEELVATLSQSREQLEKQRAHIDRLNRAIEPWLERKAVEEELAQTKLPPGVTAASGSELERLLADQQRTQSSLDESKAELAETEQQLAALELSPAFLKIEAKIRTLDKEFSRIQRDQESIPQLQNESSTIRADVESRLSALNPDWDLEFLSKFQSSLEQREKLEELASRFAQLENQRAKISARRPDLKKRVDAATDRLADLSSVQPAPELVAILEREPSYRAAAAALTDASETQASITSQLGVLKKRLSPSLSASGLTDEELEALPVPLESLLRDFQNRLATTADAAARAKTNRHQISQSLKDRNAELSARAAEEQVPDRSQLEEQRQRRDAGWQLIRKKFLGDSESSASDENIDQEIAKWTGNNFEALPDTYEAEVAESDRLADDRQAKAKEVAIRDRLVTEISQLEQDHDEAAETENARQQEHDQLTDEWHALLAGFYVLPQPPEVILEWHRTFENWLELRTQLLESLSRSRLLEEQVTDFEQQLTLSPATSNQNLDEQLTDVRRRVEEVKTASLEQAQITQALHTDEEGLKDLDNQDDQLNEQQATWSEEWARLSSTLGFPSDWSARFASKMLQELQDARQKFHESQSARIQADSLQKEVGQFEKEAESIYNEVSPDLNEFPLAEIVNRLSDRLSKAVQADRDQVSLQKAKEKTQRRADALQAELAGLSEKVETLLTSAGVSSSDEFLEAARTAQRQQESLAEQTSLIRDLKRTAGAEDFDGFLSELSQLDTDTLPLKLAELEKQHLEIEERRDAALRLESEARTALDAMDGTSKAAALQLELEGSYAKLGSSVDRLAPLVLAQTLLKRAIERFEKEHQPAMLSEVGDLLSKMTGGRYVSIRRRLDEAGTMLVEQNNGKLKTPDQLSTGTREQLYLAIRLAYVQQYCRESEPLPLIMDDILVNFDEQRAKNTLEVLLALPDHIQVLFLTCHEHMAELVRKSRPDLSPIELSPV
jgi:uncharacterized protein YhaN